MNRARPLIPAGLLLSGFLLLAHACSAQLLPIRNYTAKEGLSTGNTYAALRDTNGILWVGTSNGVDCYDGNRFFPREMPTRSGQVYVTHFIEDHEHNLWVTSWYNGIYLHRNGIFHNYLPDSVHLGSQANNTFDILEWSPGHYLVATDKNVWTFDSCANPAFHLLDPSNPTLDVQIGTLARTEKGDLLIGYDKGVARYCRTGQGTDSKWTYAGMLWTKAYVNKLVVTGDECWMGTDKGLYYYPHLSLALQDTLHHPPILRYPVAGADHRYPGAEVDHLYADPQKNIWFTTGTGAHKLMPNGSIKDYTQDNGLPSNMIRDLYTDVEGITWLATQNGLARLGQEYYHFYPLSEQRSVPPASLSLNRVRMGTVPQPEADIIAIQKDEHGCLWMGSYADLYRTRTDSLQTAMVPALEKPAGFTHCMVRDSTGHLWACTDAGILLIERDKAIRKNSFIAHCAFAGSDGSLWFGGGDGRVLYERNDAFHELAYYNPTKERIDAIYRQDNGPLWIGHNRLGLKKCRLVGDSLQLLQEYSERTGFHNLRIRCLIADGKGHLLAGTRTDGLYIFSLDSGTQPVHLTTTQGLIGNWVKAATRSPEGIYLATNNGLSLLETGEDYHNAHLHSIPFRNEQVPSELNTLFLEPGILWLGTARGVLQYMPHMSGKNNIPPPACFMKLTINGRTDSSFQPFTHEEELPVLSYSQNNLAFDFAGLSFRDEDNVRYRYKMEGLDKDWSPLTLRRYVNYSHLSPGKYRLLVMARNDDGIWSRRPAALSFRIAAPFWMQGWFIALCAVSLAVLVYLWYRYRLQQALKIERLRTKISTDLHDDIGSTLSSISIMSDMIMHSPTEGQRMAGEIRENSLSLMDKMDDIVWSINPRNDEMENLMARIQRFAAPLFEATGIDYDIVIQHHIRHLKLSMERRQHLYLIMKEAIINLVKYSGAGKARVSALSAGNALKVEISDDGKGFPADRNGAGNGIINMKNRAELMQASLHIASTPGKGTTVILTLKIN